MRKLAAGMAITVLVFAGAACSGSGGKSADEVIDTFLRKSSVTLSATQRTCIGEVLAGFSSSDRDEIVDALGRQGEMPKVAEEFLDKAVGCIAGG